MMEFLKKIFDAIAGFFKGIFAWLGFGKQDNTNAAATTPGNGAATAREGNANTAEVSIDPQALERQVALKELTDTKMRNKAMASLATVYQHDGTKAALQTSMEQKADSLFKAKWAAEDADQKAFANAASKGGFMNGEWSKKALPGYLMSSPAHAEAVNADGDLKRHWQEVNSLFDSGKMKDVGLSRLAANPVNAVAQEDVFSVDRHGLRINMPPNSRMDFKEIDANNVAITVRPISDDPKDKYNFAPITMSHVSKEVFEEGYAVVQPSKRGRAEIYTKPGVFAEGTVIAALPGSSDIASKGIDLARVIDDKGGVAMQGAVATLSTYKPGPITNKVDFSGAAMPVNTDHTDWRDDYGAAFDLAQANRNGGYYNRGGYGLPFFGAAGGNISISGPNAVPNHGLAGPAHAVPNSTLPRGRR